MVSDPGFSTPDIMVFVFSDSRHDVNNRVLLAVYFYFLHG
jgi:hypothetical protein